MLASDMGSFFFCNTLFVHSMSSIVYEAFDMKLDANHLNQSRYKLKCTAMVEPIT
jgi:hypothetical protein